MKLGNTGNQILFVTPIQYLGQGLTMITAGIAAGFVADLTKKKMRISFNYLAEKNEVIDLFGQQISRQIADEILRNPTELKGSRKKVCVMFLDIRNFTPFVEHKEPEAVVAYLNSLFGFMIEIVQSHHGIINQFLGDGFMATFGAPISSENICRDAVESAIAIINKTDFDSKNGNIASSRIGIGLHYGEAVTGNIGSAMRKQYSITGSVVIIASRIEQLTKQYKPDLLLSEEVYFQLDEETRKQLSPIGPVLVKGRENPVSIYGLT
jgi:adenylate cyclase